MNHKASIYFGTGRMLMIGTHLEAREHELSVISCLISLKESFQISVAGGPWQQTNGTMVDANVKFALRNFVGDYVTIAALVPERRRGVRLRETIFKNNSCYHLQDHELKDFRKRFSTCQQTKVECLEAFQIATDFLDNLLGDYQPTKKPDPRIAATVGFIQKNLTEIISAKELAKIAFLSEDRFLHLFKEQLGLPLRQFILYQRMLYATREFLGGKSLTEAAHTAGFSDSAHFSRTFLEMNGLKPSHMAKLSKNYDLFFCEDLSWL